MRRPTLLDEKNRFSGQLRHYHRSGVSNRRSWEQWVDGEDSKPSGLIKCLKISGIVLAVLALGAIIAGLVISLQ